MRLRSLAAFGTITALFALTACGATAAEEAAPAAAPDDPSKKLVFAMPPGTDDPAMLEMLDDLSLKVGEATDREIELQAPADYLGVVEAVRNGHVDVAMLSQFSAALAFETGSVDPLLVWGADDVPASICFSGVDSGIESVEDVRGKQVAFVDPGSTTGHFMPRALFAKAGLVAEQDYTMTFAGGHDSALLGLAKGDVDVACTATQLEETFIEAGIIDPSKVHKFAESDPIPIGSSIVVRDDLDLKTRDDLIANLPGLVKADEGLAELFGENEVTANPTGDVYAPLIEVARSVGVELKDIR